MDCRLAALEKRTLHGSRLPTSICKSITGTRPLLILRPTPTSEGSDIPVCRVFGLLQD